MEISEFFHPPSSQPASVSHYVNFVFSLGERSDIVFSVHAFSVFTVLPAVTHPDCKYMLFTSPLNMHVL